MRTGLLAAGLVVVAMGLGCGGNASNAAAPNSSGATLKSIQVTAPSNVIVGQILPVTATGIYSDKTTKDLSATVTWTSSNPNIATVAAGGTLTAVSSGTVTITATMNSVSGSSSVSIAPKLVSIAISPANPTIAAETQQAFKATGTYSDNSQQNITGTVNWSSSQPAVATIGNSSPLQGLAQGVSKGTTTITASSDGVSATTSLNVTDATGTQLVIAPANFTLPLDTSHQFTATATFTDGTTQDVTGVVAWSSSSSSIATVTVSGLATAKSLGTTNISAAFEGLSTSTPMTVNASNLSSISIQPANGNIAQGTKALVSATGTFSDGSTHNLTQMVTWSSSDSTIATFGTTKSQVSGLRPGSVTITATLGSVTASAPFNVTNATIQSITVTPVNQTIPIGWHQPFTATGLFSDSSIQDISSSVTWSSNHSSFASIGAGSGVALGSSPGSTNIAATFSAAGATATGTTSLTVDSATLSSISLSPTSALLTPGSSLQFNAKGTWNDANASSQGLNGYVTWNSSNNQVASVGGSGNVTGQSVGTAILTAQSGSLSATSSLVVETGQFSIQLGPQNLSLPATIKTQLKAIGIFTNGNLDLTSAVTWTSSSPSIATVSNAEDTAGQVTGISPGTTTISAVFAGQSATLTLTVTNATLISNGITVTPENPTISLGSAEAFVAQGTFSDGSVFYITSQVTWSSSDVAVATINSTGHASSASQGTTTIKAGLDGVSGTTILTVQ